MIKALTKQTVINATSVVTVQSPTGEVDTPINHMSATIQTNGKFVISQAIQNEEVYLEHLEVAKQDYDDFYNHLIEYVNKDKE